MNTARFVGLSIAVVVALQAPFVRATPETWVRVGQLEVQGNPTGALQALETLPTVERQGYLYLLRRGWLLYQAGRFDESVVAYRAASAASSNAIEPALGELLPLLALRRWQEVETRATAVLRRDPNNYLAMRRLALALYNMGRFDTAERMYKQVLAQYPSDLEMLSGVGWCAFRQGRKDEAAAAFRSVLEVNNDATARAGLEAATAQAAVR